MKQILIFIVTLVAVGCNLSQPSYNKITIAEVNDSTKVVASEIYYVDTVIFAVPNVVSDSLILASIKQYTDSVRRDSIRKDSIQLVNFRQITRIINGGYNGYQDRLRLWNNAKKVLK